MTAQQQTIVDVIIAAFQAALKQLSVPPITPPTGPTDGGGTGAGPTPAPVRHGGEAETVGQIGGLQAVSGAATRLMATTAPLINAARGAEGAFDAALATTTLPVNLTQGVLGVQNAQGVQGVQDAFASGLAIAGFTDLGARAFAQ